MTFANPTGEQREMWLNTKRDLQLKLLEEHNKKELDSEQIEFLTERLLHITNMLYPPRDDNNPAIN